MATVLSGTAGALYYKPAGTTATFAESGVNATTDVVTVSPFLGFKVGDPVQFSVVNVNTGLAGTGTLPGGISAATTYYVIGYTAATGALSVSATLGGTILAITDDGTAVTPNTFQVAYATAEAVGQVREWTFEVTREEIDVTTIGAAAGQFVPFRTYISGFADGEGSAMVYTTDEDTSIASRMVQDVLQRDQTGAKMKLYIDRVTSGGTVSDALSRFIDVEVILTSASFGVNPDDGQMVEIAFRPSAAPTFDLSKST
jgi:hypothetical protein